MTLPRPAKIVFHHSIVTWWNKVWHFCQVLCVSCNPRKTSKSFRNQHTLVLLCLQEEKKKKLFENQAPQVLLQQNPLEIKYPSSLRSAKNTWNQAPSSAGYARNEVRRSFFSSWCNCNQKKPSKNFRNQNTLVLLGLQKEKKTPWKSSTQSSVVKNHSKSSIPNLLGLPKKVENQATDFWRNMRGDTLEPSTYFCWNCKQDFEIKHLLLFGMQTEREKKKKPHEDQAKHLLLLGMPKKNSWKSSTYFFCWVWQKHLKSTTTSGNWVTYSCNNYPNKQTDKQSFNIYRKQKSLSLSCSLLRFRVI